MDEKPNRPTEFNRRDFLRSGSTATLMTMLGGVKLTAQAEPEATPPKPAGPRLKLAVIGLGTWGREIVNTLARIPQAEVAALCDTYAPAIRRCETAAPKAKQTADYRSLLKDPDLPAVIVATPTHRHQEIVLAALEAGKHVYCEAPLAHTLDAARAIALAAKGVPQLVFQSGLQLRCDPQRRELIRTFRSGALGRRVMGRAQWHRKTSWRASASKPEREKDLNWRLERELSLGLIGELGIHPLDQADWFLAQHPVAVTGFGSTVVWEDGRQVPDTVQAIVQYAGGFSFCYDATLGNSFDEEYELYYGSDSAVLLRQSDIWLFKEVDAQMLGWEVYFPKQQFYKETGIVLKVGASKSTAAGAQPGQVEPSETPLLYALKVFVGNAADITAAREDFLSAMGDDPAALRKHLSTAVPRRPAPGFLEGYQATVTAIHANAAVTAGQRVELKPELYTLG